ncbi:putative DNA-binding protein [Pediococcus pentosaceus]|uniref:putative DNA-binding protein n=1 Tax=Pediococcus pentosaceus TaxID=1255 RepID=UPI00115294D6|nr:putative DNA-binding protein [Pediococcus pentosaceus]QDJ24128.1 DNA-binding protein [Pediococcus pentosaceus]
MEIEKNNRINSLLEFYEQLLTPKQKEYITLYYADDYSLGEISEEFQVSRQAVYDNIKRTANILEKYEQQLHLLSNFEVRNAKFDQIRAYINQKYPEDTELKHFLDDLEKSEEE